MRQYCDALRSVRAAIGDGHKRIMPCEENTRKAFRRYLAAVRDLPAGSVLGMEDLCFKKVVNGIAPKHLDLVIGSRLTQDVAEDTVITWAMLQHG
jgi:N,N'-diacetyllegionaminate synthase